MVSGTTTGTVVTSVRVTRRRPCAAEVAVPVPLSVAMRRTGRCRIRIRWPPGPRCPAMVRSARRLECAVGSPGVLPASIVALVVCGQWRPVHRPHPARRRVAIDRRPPMTAPPLPGFQPSTFRHQGRSHQVYRAGNGPAVIVIHEIPGIHPGMVSFAQRLLQAGFSVYLPSLFGRPGQPVSTGAVLRSILRVCVSREFAILADRTSPVVTWLRALAATAHRDCGGPGVGAIGMCLTGGFALSMAVEPAVLAPVVSQPGLPAPLTACKRPAVGLDPADLAAVKERTHGGLCVLGLRFSADRGCPVERFRTLRR